VWKPYFTQGHKQTSIHTFHVWSPMLVNFGIRDLHIMLLRTYEFQAQEVILGTSETHLLFINRTKSRAITGLLTRHTLRSHPYVMRLCNKPTYKKCGTEEETSVYICTSVRIRLHSDMQSSVLSFWTLRILWIEVEGPSETVVNEQGSFNKVADYGAQRACFKA
jgi:hypothetical protein